MAIQFHPKYGQILYCDFTSGFREPEMVKNRPVIVISRSNNQVCTVVPLSGTKPDPVRSHHYEISPASLPNRLAAQGSWWAKCDMVTTVGFWRLDRVKEGKDANGKRQFSTKCLNDNDLREVKKCVIYALCLSDLTQSDG